VLLALSEFTVKPARIKTQQFYSPSLALIEMVCCCREAKEPLLLR